MSFSDFPTVFSNHKIMQIVLLLWPTKELSNKFMLDPNLKLQSVTSPPPVLPPSSCSSFLLTRITRNSRAPHCNSYYSGNEEEPGYLHLLWACCLSLLLPSAPFRILGDIVKFCCCLFLAHAASRLLPRPEGCWWLVAWEGRNSVSGGPLRFELNAYQTFVQQKRWQRGEKIIEMATWHEARNS